MCEHDSAALKARQCRVDGGLREENEPLATTAKLPRTARTARYEEAKCDNARNLRDIRPSARNTATQAGPN
jgi:hypothetical protein